MYDGIKNLGCWIGEKTRNTLLGILNFIKTYVLLMNKKDERSKINSLGLVIKVCVVILVLSLYPQVKKYLNNAATLNAWWMLKEIHKRMIFNWRVILILLFFLFQFYYQTSNIPKIIFSQHLFDYTNNFISFNVHMNPHK